MQSINPRNVSTEVPQMSAPRTSNSNLKISAARFTKVTHALLDEEDLNSHSHLERNLSAKITAMAERRAQRCSDLQQQLAYTQEELKKTKHQMTELEKEKARVLDELQETKKVAEEASLRLSETLLAQKKWETEKLNTSQLEHLSNRKRDHASQLELDAIQKQHALDVEALLTVAQELNQLKQQLASSDNLKNEALILAEDARFKANLKSLDDAESIGVSDSIADHDEESETSGSEEVAVQTTSLVESLRNDIENSKDIEAKLVERDSMIEKIKLELKDARNSESRILGLLSDSRMDCDRLRQEVEEVKESETRTFESLHFLAKELEQTKISLEEAKIDIDTLHESNRGVNIIHGKTAVTDVESQGIPSQNAVFETIKSGGKVPNAHLIHPPESQAVSLSNVTDLAKEMTFLSNELKLAIEAEEKSRKAMDDLALALKEVTADGNEVKAKLASTVAELEGSRMEVEYTNVMLKNTEERYQTLLGEARREIEKANKMIERLKLEADESLTAWSDKELGFVECIKKTEEEIAIVKEENQRSVGSLQVAEIAVKEAKAENGRLRDILKQALNEATVAKEASEIAKAENSQLKDSLSDMATTVERLKINEAAALEKIKELKGLVDKNKDLNKGLETKELKKTVSNVKDGKISKMSMELPQKPRSLNLELERPKLPNENKKTLMDFDILEGSIFTEDSPKQDNPQLSLHRKAHSLILTADRKMDESQIYSVDDQKNPAATQKKKRAMLVRFGEFLRKKNSK